MIAIQIFGYIIGCLVFSAIGFLIVKLLVSFAKMDEESRKVFKNKQNEKSKI